MPNSQPDYVLGRNKNKNDAKIEYERLEFQNNIKQYGLGNLLLKKDVDLLKEKSKILDLGSGSGFITNWLFSNLSINEFKITAIDNYRELLNYYLRKIPSKYKFKVKGIEDDFLELSKVENESQDIAFTRYTAQHTPNNLQDYFSSVYEKLKPGGEFIIIDGDGISLNLRTSDPVFNQQIIDFTYSLESYTPQILPRIHSHLISSGFQIKEMRSDVKIFATIEDLRSERKVWEYRFSLIRAKAIKFFGGEKKADQYIARYLDEIIRKANMMYFVQFIFFATKPNQAKKLPNFSA